MPIQPFLNVPKDLREWTRYLNFVKVQADTAISAQTADLATLATNATNATNAANAALADLATLATSAVSADDAALLGGQLPSYYRNAANLNAGTLADARVAQSNVTQHQAALSIAESQIPDGSIFPRLSASETISGAWTYTGIQTYSLPPILPSYTVAGAPSAATYARGLIYVSNESGGAVVAFSDGTNWRRVTDRAVIT